MFVKRSKNVALGTGQNKNENLHRCSGSHRLYACVSFKNQEARLCFNCFSLYQ